MARSPISYALGVAPAGLFSFFFLASRAFAELTLLTTELPPYSYMKDGVLQGAMVELVAEMARRVGHSGAMEFGPFARVQQMALSDPNAALVMQARTPEREEDYKWIAWAFNDESVFVTRAADAVVVNDLEDARALRVAAIRSSSSESFLKRAGFQTIDLGHTADVNARKLMAQRVDAWLGNRMMVVYSLRSNGYDVADVKFSPPIRPLHFYFAGNRALPDQETAPWAAALEAMRRDGAFDRIMAQYR